MLAIGLGLVFRLAAAESKSLIEIGATRDDVISTYGNPAGESKLGSREVLSYPQGQITLESGRVVRVEPKKKGAPAPAPKKPAAAAAAPVTVPAPVAVPLGHWFVDFEAAAREAVRREVPILALFSGPAGSAASRLFLEEVALHPDFAATFSGDYVFLRADSPAGNDAKWSRFGVVVFPTVLFLSPKGERLAAADFTHLPGKGTLRAEAISSLREIRARLALGGGGPLPASVQSKSPDTTSPLDMDRLSPFALKTGMRSAEATIVAATVAGIALACLIGWLLWRTRAKPRPYQGKVLAARISEAASGIPTLPEILAWSKDQVCVMAAVLAESEGYEADRVLDRDDKDLLLTRRGEIQPSAVVRCSPGRAGTVTAKSVRDLAATIVANRLQTGWYVSPAGFSNDARAYAAQHKLLLIDGAHLIARMHDLPPILIPKLQTNNPW